MNFTRRTHLRALAGATALAMAGLPALAQDSSSEGASEGSGGGTVHEVLMLNRDPETNERQVYVPSLLEIQPGDTVRFISEDPGHNVQTTDDMIPEGAEEFESDIGEDFETTFDTPGAYGLHCTPHQTAGMVMLVLVGEVDPEQYESLKDVRQRGKADDRWEELFAEADEIVTGDGSS